MRTVKDIEVLSILKKREIQFRLWFDGYTRPIEFALSFDRAMMVMKGLQKIQATHKISIPEQVRPRGKPKLSIVTRDE
jgi:hypothetical protein